MNYFFFNLWISEQQKKAKRNYLDKVVQGINEELQEVGFMTIGEIIEKYQFPFEFTLDVIFHFLFSLSSIFLIKKIQIQIVY